jgi:lantibiotic modifying enzyme
VLARFVASRLHLTLQSAEELSARLIKDNPALISGFGVSVEELVHVAWGLSDLHQGGRSVCRLSFGNGQSIYYKPRSMGPDKFLLAISESLGSDLRPALPRPWQQRSQPKPRFKPTTSAQACSLRYAI